MSDYSASRIALLKTQRGHLAAFGQTEKVKAVDLEIAQLRQQRSDAKRAEAQSASPAPEVETATEDTSRVESAASVRRGAAKKRRASAARKADD